MRICFVVGCHSSTRHLNKWKGTLCETHDVPHDDRDQCDCPPPISFFNFPNAQRRNEERLKWIRQINRGDPEEPDKLLDPTRWSIVCNKHFIRGYPTPCHPYPELHLKPFGKVEPRGRKCKVVCTSKPSDNAPIKFATTNEDDKAARSISTTSTMTVDESPAPIEYHTLADDVTIPSSTAVVEAVCDPLDDYQLATLPTTKPPDLITITKTGAYRIKFGQQDKVATYVDTNNDILAEVFSKQKKEKEPHDRDDHNYNHRPHNHVLKALRFIIFVLLNALRYKKAILEEREREIQQLRTDKRDLQDIIRKQSCFVEKYVNGETEFVPVTMRRCVAKKTVTGTATDTSPGIDTSPGTDTLSAAAPAKKPRSKVAVKRKQQVEIKLPAKVLSVSSSSPRPVGRPRKVVIIETPASLQEISAQSEIPAQSEVSAHSGNEETVSDVNDADLVNTEDDCLTQHVFLAKPKATQASKRSPKIDPASPRVGNRRRKNSALKFDSDSGFLYY